VKQNHGSVFLLLTVDCRLFLPKNSSSQDLVKLRPLVMDDLDQVSCTLIPVQIWCVPEMALRLDA
jgi:hypothetical protein